MLEVYKTKCQEVYEGLDRSGVTEELLEQLDSCMANLDNLTREEVIILFSWAETSLRKSDNAADGPAIALVFDVMVYYLMSFEDKEVSS